MAAFTASTTLYNVYDDNLGSAEVTADSNNRVQEVTDCAPFHNLYFCLSLGARLGVLRDLDQKR